MPIWLPYRSHFRLAGPTVTVRRDSLGGGGGGNDKIMKSTEALS